MALGDVFRTVCRGQIGTDEWVNVLHFKQISSGAGDLGGLHDTIKSTIYDVLKTYNTSTWSLIDITSSALVIGGGAFHLTTYNLAGTDSTAAGAGAKFNAMVSKFTTGLAGRSHRGRAYWAINAADLVPAGVWNSAAHTAVQDAVAALVPIYGPSGTDTDYHWVVWSRKLGETITGGHVTAYDLTAGAFTVSGVTTDTIVRVQRRREVGKGA